MSPLVGHPPRLQEAKATHMSPTPTDVSYRSANTMDRGSAYVANPGPLKGVREEHAVVAADARVTRMNGNTSSSSQAFSSNGTGNGAGPGNMSSGISVQELKQMTALRMAQAQGHLRVVSPFQYGENMDGNCNYISWFRLLVMPRTSSVCLFLIVLSCDALAGALFSRSFNANNASEIVPPLN